MTRCVLAGVYIGNQHLLSFIIRNFPRWRGRGPPLKTVSARVTPSGLGATLLNQHANRNTQVRRSEGGAASRSRNSELLATKISEKMYLVHLDFLFDDVSRRLFRVLFLTQRGKLLAHIGQGCTYLWRGHALRLHIKAVLYIREAMIY